MTMKELAKLAGVSSSAVSRYLNGGPLSQDKRERIRAAIEETGYQPDYAAQMLRTKTTDYVGLIIPKLDSEAVTRVTRGASVILSENGYLSLVADTDGDPMKEIEYLKLFQERRVAGIIIMATMLTPQHEEIIKNSSIPIIVVGQRFPQIPCIYHDDFGAAHDIAALMIEKGRKRLGMIGVTEMDVAVGQNRHKGVLSAMMEKGLNPTDLRYEISDFSPEGGYQAMERMLEDGLDIDGLICATDRIAFGALECLRKHNISVPETLSVAGMDDNWACEQIVPHLTTAHFYFRTSGETAAKLLLNMINTDEYQLPVMQTMLDYTIIERDSV